MDLRHEIARNIGLLPSALQEQVLRYVVALKTSTPIGESGSSLRRFSSSLDPLSARQMIEAIESECERVEAGEW